MTIDTTEIFLPIDNFRGIYEISNRGRVRTLRHGRYHRERIRVLPRDGNGYSMVGLTKNGKYKPHKVHRLVALAFIPNPTNLPNVHHKNSIKTDNRVENLEWCDGRHNQNHYFKTRKTSSKYPGVSWHKGTQKWEARTKIGSVKKHLGVFSDEKEAAEAYEEAVNDTID